MTNRETEGKTRRETAFRTVGRINGTLRKREIGRERETEKEREREREREREGGDRKRRGVSSQK